MLFGNDWLAFCHFFGQKPCEAKSDAVALCIRSLHDDHRLANSTIIHRVTIVRPYCTVTSFEGKASGIQSCQARFLEKRGERRCGSPQNFLWSGLRCFIAVATRSWRLSPPVTAWASAHRKGHFITLPAAPRWQAAASLKMNCWPMIKQSPAPALLRGSSL